MTRATLLLLALLSARAFGADAVTLVLNWVPGADHAPFFYAEQQGWYRDAGVELTIDSVAGSPEAVKRAVGEPRTVAVADFVSFLRSLSADRRSVAVMALQPRSPYAVYFRHSTGSERAADLAGKRIAAMEQDPMRGLWTALAGRNGFDASQTRWVPLSNAQKPDALAKGEVDAALNPFLHNHLNYEAALGADLRVIWWHELGFSAPGQVLVASSALIESSPEVLRRFVAVTQRAWRDCLADGSPCIDALLQANPQLERDREGRLWQLVRQMYVGADRKPAPIGAFDENGVDEAVRFITHALSLRPPTGPVVTNALLPSNVAR